MNDDDDIVPNFKKKRKKMAFRLTFYVSLQFGALRSEQKKNEHLQ